MLNIETEHVGKQGSRNKEEDKNKKYSDTEN